MELIFFEGGHMDGKTYDVDGDLADMRLFFDGSKTLGSPNSAYERTQTLVVVDGVERTVWRAL